MEFSTSFAPTSFARLPDKSTVRIAVKWKENQNEASSGVLLVFLNGLMSTMASWEATVAKVFSSDINCQGVSVLCYDRFGQGETTDRDPRDGIASDPSHGHTILDTISDLHQLILQVTSNNLKRRPHIILVGNSIGCATARLYAQHYPGTVAGLLLLDSVLANSTFVEVYPDPDAPAFDISNLPEGVTLDDLRHAREFTKRRFHPEIGSSEGLSRRNLQSLLPSASQPRLVGSLVSQDAKNTRGPYVTVMGHGSDEFARQNEISGVKAALVQAYVNPYWWKYNEGLTQITNPEHSRGPIEAVGAGHFIQVDRPDLVAAEVLLLVHRILSEKDLHPDE